MFLRIARDPSRYFFAILGFIPGFDPDESAASPGDAKHTTAFWSDQGQTLPDHYGLVTAAFHRVSTPNRPASWDH
jgi:hypothetical protein